MPARTNNDTNTPKTIHHCYLLQSLTSPSKTYIGYTVNPHRRIQQHNGILKGGATYTSRFRPWKFIAITEGFKTETKGLQFEWAWQHPKRSKIFRGGLGNGGGMALAGVLEKQKGYIGKLRLLMILLCESQEFKNESLNVYFFDREKYLEFDGLFNRLEEEQYDDGEEEWCKALPAQMSARVVECPAEMPFYRDILATQKRKKGKRSKKKNTGAASNADSGSGSGSHISDSLVERIIDNLTEMEDRDEGDFDLNVDGDHMHYDHESGEDSEYAIEEINEIQRLSIGRNSDNEGWNNDNTDSSSVIDLLDSSDDDSGNANEIRAKENDSGHEHFDMDLCSPVREGVADLSYSTIDLTKDSSFSMNENKFSKLSLVEGLNSEDSDSSVGTVDMCSPEKELVRI